RLVRIGLKVLRELGGEVGRDVEHERTEVAMIALHDGDHLKNLGKHRRALSQRPVADREGGLVRVRGVAVHLVDLLTAPRDADGGAVEHHVLRRSSNGARRLVARSQVERSTAHARRHEHALADTEALLDHRDGRAFQSEDRKSVVRVARWITANTWTWQEG